VKKINFNSPGPPADNLHVMKPLRSQPSFALTAHASLVIGAALHGFDLLLLGGFWDRLVVLETHALALLALPLAAALGLLLAASAYLIDDQRAAGVALTGALLNASWLVLFAILGVAMGRHLGA
jgi:hypothetical protein